MMLFMVIGYPASFSLAAVGLFFGFIGIELGLIRADFLGNLTFQLFAIVSNDLLLAIPFFTLMGTILERCGLAEDLLEGFGQLFGPMRGGLSYAVILVGAVLGAITGTVAASVIAMGIISLPVMMRYGYSVRHTTGVIAASVRKKIGELAHADAQHLQRPRLGDRGRHRDRAVVVGGWSGGGGRRLADQRLGVDLDGCGGAGGGGHAAIEPSSNRRRAA